MSLYISRFSLHRHSPAIGVHFLLKVGAPTASAKREPITGVWGRAPTGPRAESLVRDQGGGFHPLKQKAFCLSELSTGQVKSSLLSTLAAESWIFAYTKTIYKSATTKSL